MVRLFVLFLFCAVLLFVFVDSSTFYPLPSFLWKMKTHVEENEDLVEVYKWTGANSFFVIHSRKINHYFAMGGG